MKKYLLNNSGESPVHLNHTNMELVERSIYHAGDLKAIEYYLSHSHENNQFDGLAVSETYTYYRDPFDVSIVKHECKTTWYLEDGTEGTSVVKAKIYDPADGIKKQEAKRWNLVNQAKAYMLMNIGYLNSAELLNEADALRIIGLYVQEIKNPLYNFIQDAQKEYLSEQVKAGLLGILKQ